MPRGCSMSVMASRGGAEPEVVKATEKSTHQWDQRQEFRSQLSHFLTRRSWANDLTSMNLQNGIADAHSEKLL